MKPERPDGESSDPFLAGIAFPIYWLRSHGIDARSLASWFGTNPNHIHQLTHRGRLAAKRPVHHFLSVPLLTPADTFAEPTDQLRERLGVRRHEDSVILDRSEMRRLDRFEETVEELAEQFWTGVRFETGLSRLTDILPLIGFPAHHRRVRLYGRLRQLIAETLLHSGRTASSLDEGLRSLHLYRIAHHESEDPVDLGHIARSARLVSQAYLIRTEPELAAHYLEIHRQASVRAGIPLRAEYYHQLGTAAFQRQEYLAAKPHFVRSMDVLAETVDYGRSKQKHEVLDIGMRHLNLLPPVNWDGACELSDYMLQCWPEDDIHVSLSATFTAACGFLTDSPELQRDATDLLYRYQNASRGFSRQETSTRLLLLTPELPAGIRADWARLSLYQNALNNR